MENRFPHFILPQLSKREVHEMGRNGVYKQEILLFGLADWVMGKWKHAHDLSLKNREAYQETGFAITVAMVRDSIETVGYVSPPSAFLLLFVDLMSLQGLIAIGAFPTSVSIGNMRLCQTCAESLVKIVKSFNHQLEDLVLYIFLGTAFLESLRVEETLLKTEEKLIEYKPVEHLSGRKGMRIEAKCVR